MPLEICLGLDLMPLHPKWRGVWACAPPQQAPLVKFCGVHLLAERLVSSVATTRRSPNTAGICQHGNQKCQRIEWTKMPHATGLQSAISWVGDLGPVGRLSNVSNCFILRCERCVISYVEVIPGDIYLLLLGLQIGRKKLGALKKWAKSRS